jgi:hypothetical protein
VAAWRGGWRNIWQWRNQRINGGGGIGAGGENNGVICGEIGGVWRRNVGVMWRQRWRGGVAANQWRRRRRNVARRQWLA